MTWLRAVVLAVGLCVFASAWSWLVRGSGPRRELWRMRLLAVVIALLLLEPMLGGFPTPASARTRALSLQRAALAVERYIPNYTVGPCRRHSDIWVACNIAGSTDGFLVRSVVDVYLHRRRGTLSTTIWGYGGARTEKL